jgi:hypothetical protein
VREPPNETAFNLGARIHVLSDNSKMKRVGISYLKAGRSAG